MKFLKDCFGALQLQLNKIEILFFGYNDIGDLEAVHEKASFLVLKIVQPLTVLGDNTRFFRYKEVLDYWVSQKIKFRLGIHFELPWPLPYII